MWGVDPRQDMKEFWSSLCQAAANGRRKCQPEMTCNFVIALEWVCWAQVSLLKTKKLNELGLDS